MFHSKVFYYLFAIFSVSSAANVDLPDDLLIGFATASYQIEGGWNASGKGENIWDRLTHQRPDLISDGSTGDVAADSYHKWEDDIQALKDTGAQVYRFSLSWSRILPNGEYNSLNKDGVDYYNKLIDGLVENNITPLVTLYHWDLPQALQDLGGWPNPLLADYFEEYARAAFENFGDRVKNWITLNEPLEVTKGYAGANSAPLVNHPGTGDYLTAHTLIRAHVKAYRLYDQQFRGEQGGVVGITLNAGWNEPKTNSSADVEAAERANQFDHGWFAHPIFLGDYPPIMREVVDENSKAEGRLHSRLPTFTTEEIEYIKGSSDFFGLNHYGSSYAEPGNGTQGSSPSYNRDRDVQGSVDPNWPTAASGWLHVVPWGFRKLLNYLKDTYNDPIIYVTENGFSDLGELDDGPRTSYYHDYIEEMLNSIYDHGTKVKVYTAWSLIDNMEWNSGYTIKFGVYHVDFNDPNRPRTPKNSAKFFQELTSTRKLPQVRKSVRV